GVTGGDRGLQRVRAEWSQALGPLERSEAASDEQGIPATSILVRQQNRFAMRTHAGVESCRLELHERQEPMHLGFVRLQSGENAAESYGVIAERRPHPVVARRRRVSLVED